MVFTDERVSFEQFAAAKDDYPFRCLPVVEIDGTPVTQSNALARYFGRKAGLYPEDPLQALYCDEVLDSLEDLTQRIGRTFGLEGDALKKAREDLVDGWLSISLAGIAKLLARGGGRYFAGDCLTVADLRAFLQLRSLRSGMLDHVPADIVERVAPELAGYCDRIASESVVRSYYESREAARQSNEGAG